MYMRGFWAKSARVLDVNRTDGHLRPAANSHSPVPQHTPPAYIPFALTHAKTTMRLRTKILAAVVLLAAASVAPWACGHPTATPLGAFPTASTFSPTTAPATASATRAVVPDGSVRFTFDGALQPNGLPAPWDCRVIVGHLQAGVVDGPAAGERALRIRCEKSHVVCMYKAVPFDPDRLPIITWQWRADVLPAKGDTRTHKALPLLGDNRNDKALQVMVAFEGDNVLNYVWDQNAPVGYECDEFSPVATVKTRVIETGPPTPGQWRTERVDVRADYVRRFGHPPGKVTGIGISANTNHTASVGDGAVGPVSAVPR